MREFSWILLRCPMSTYFRSIILLNALSTFHKEVQHVHSGATVLSCAITSFRKRQLELFWNRKKVRAVLIRVFSGHFEEGKKGNRSSPYLFLPAPCFPCRCRSVSRLILCTSFYLIFLQSVNALIFAFVRLKRIIFNRKPLVQCWGSSASASLL